MHDDGMIGGPALDPVQARHRGGVRRVGAEAVDRFGGKGDEAAGAEDLRGAQDLATHVVPGNPASR